MVASSILTFATGEGCFAFDEDDGVVAVDDGHDNTRLLLSRGDSGSTSDFTFFGGRVLVLARADGAASCCSNFTVATIGARLCRESTTPLCKAASQVRHSTAAHCSHRTDPDKAAHSSQRAIEDG